MAYCMMVFTWPLQMQTKLSWMKYDFNIEPNKQQHCFPSSHTCKSYSIYLYKDVHVYIQYVSEILESFSD